MERGRPSGTWASASGAAGRPRPAGRPASRRAMSQARPGSGPPADPARPAPGPSAFRAGRGLRHRSDRRRATTAPRSCASADACWQVPGGTTRPAACSSASGTDPPRRTSITPAERRRASSGSSAARRAASWSVAGADDAAHLLRTSRHPTLGPPRPRGRRRYCTAAKRRFPGASVRESARDRTSVPAAGDVPATRRSSATSGAPTSANVRSAGDASALAHAPRPVGTGRQVAGSPVRRPLHLIEPARWRAALARQVRPPSLTTSASCTCRRPTQVHLPAARSTPVGADLVLLVIDPARLPRPRPAPSPEPANGLGVFPHLYGPLPTRRRRRRRALPPTRPVRAARARTTPSGGRWRTTPRLPVRRAVGVGDVPGGVAVLDPDHALSRTTTGCC